MGGLWGDGWFYISGGGFLVSCFLFVLLLGQYRAAIEAEEDGEEGQEAPAAAEAEKIYVPRPIEPISRVPEPMPSVESVRVVSPIAAVKAEPSVQKPEEKKKSETTTGGLSPAVVYLQSLKAQIDHLDKELSMLRGLASQQAAQGELILNRLSDLGERLSAVEAPAAVEPPASQPAAEPEPQPVVSTPVTEELKTVILQPPQQEAAAAEPPPASAEAAPPSAEPAAAEEPRPARKGPVWPI